MLNTRINAVTVTIIHPAYAVGAVLTGKIRQALVVAPVQALIVIVDVGKITTRAVVFHSMEHDFERNSRTRTLFNRHLDTVNPFPRVGLLAFHHFDSIVAVNGG